MKKAIYYAALICMIIFFWFVAGGLFTLIFNGTDNFAYNLGGWCGQPYIILLSVGIALLFRGLLYHGIFKEVKRYSHKVAFILIGAAILWGGWMIGARSIYEYAQNKALTEYLSNQEGGYLDDVDY